MADKSQRKVNKVIRFYNKSFMNDISPYNLYRIQQVRRQGYRETDENIFWEINILKDNKVINTRWFNEYEIYGINKGKIGSRLFWWINDTVIKTKAK